MKRPLLFAIISLVLLYAVRAVEYAGLRRNVKGEFAKLRQTFIEENNYDLLIIGSSRAECQFYTPRIDSITGLKSFNIGMIGSIMPFTRATLEAYLVHSKAPKYVVLNLDLHSFSDNPDTVYNFPRYFAFLGNDKLYEGLKARDKRFVFFNYLPFCSMPYYSARYLNASLRGWTGNPGKYDSDYEQGFSPHIQNTTLGDIDTISIAVFNHEPPPIIWEELDKIEAICRQNGSMLILAVSPLFHRWQDKVVNYSTVLEQFHTYATQHNLGFIDLSFDPIQLNKTMYADPAHLNKSGALAFTRHFSVKLMQYIRP
ncbi:MAG: hypothetical protein ABIQ40_17735 [Bacteroidia bacterium]